MKSTDESRCLLDDQPRASSAGGLPAGELPPELARYGRGIARGTSTDELSERRTRGVSRRENELTDLLGSLCREHHQRHVRYAMGRLGERTRAEDVVQRAYEKVWRRCPDPAELGNPAGYLATAVRNEINQELRSLAVRRNRLGPPTDDKSPVLDHIGCPAPTTPHDADVIVDRLMLAEALSALPPRQRQAVVLRLQWQLSVTEAAATMHVSTGAVKGYLHHGLRSLRRRWEPA